MKIITLFIIVFLFACNSNEDKIVGRWKIVKIDENYGKLVEGVVYEVQFFPNGELIHLRDGKLSGIGKYRYEIIGDTLYKIEGLNEPDPKNRFRIGHYYKWNNDTLILQKDDSWTYFVRND